MSHFRKIVLAFLATSIAATPVASSAAPAARALTNSAGANDLGGSSWLIGLIGLMAGIAAIAIIASDDDDAPVSP